MTQSLDFYIETARENLQKKLDIPHISDRALSNMLELNQSAINQWKKRGTFPSEKAMMQLAVLGELNVATALMDLHSWKSDGEMKAYYTLLGTFLGKYKINGQDIITAFLDNKSAKHSDAEQEKQFSDFLQKITQAAALSVLFLASLAPFSTAQASEKVSNDKSVSIYYVN